MDMIIMDLDFLKLMVVDVLVQGIQGSMFKIIIMYNFFILEMF